MCTQLSFTLGALTLEQAKHLTAADAGALAGPHVPGPSLRTWRERLGELADTCDPLALQRRLASQMLAIEPAESQATWPMTTSPSTPATKRSRSAATRAADKPTKGHRRHLYLRPGRTGDLVHHRRALPALCTTLPPCARGAHRRPSQRATSPARACWPLIVFDRGAAFPGTFTAVDAAG